MTIRIMIISGENFCHGQKFLLKNQFGTKMLGLAMWGQNFLWGIKILEKIVCKIKLFIENFDPGPNFMQKFSSKTENLRTKIFLIVHKAIINILIVSHHHLHQF